ncbi:MAG: hypothetical protein WCA38_21465 [Candidatus Acidiferrales bacterium]
MSKREASRYSEIGCRIPKDYFWVIGWGESDVGIETGSYDAALHMAGHRELQRHAVHLRVTA